MSSRMTNCVVILLFFVCWGASAEAQDQNPAEGTAVSDTAPYRIALAISGGASMGAYEAGLLWGMIEVLRHLEYSEGWSQGGVPRPIEISSIAGTSAGGINTLLAALAWAVNPETTGGFSNRIDDNIFRDVWLSPDVNRLLPPQADSSLYLKDDALLSRRALVAVAREMAEKWSRPGTFRPGLRLPLGFTVTRVKPETLIASGVVVENQRFYIPMEMRTQANGSALFAFDPHDYPALNDPAMILMPWAVGDAPLSVSNRQIEEVLLTTSAFPVGFGRKRLHYCRQKALTDSAQGPPPTMGNASLQAGGIGAARMCPDGYELEEAEFADGGLFDNLPIGLARLLSEKSQQHQKIHTPVRYIYLDPNRERYATRRPEDRNACEKDLPSDACREMTFDLASEAEVLGGAIGTARKYELYRELTSDQWRLNLSHLSRRMADQIDANSIPVECDADLPFFDRPLECSDRLRHAARLLELAHSHRRVPVIAPMSTRALTQQGIATTCRQDKEGADVSIVAACRINAKRLRIQMVRVLADLSDKMILEQADMNRDIQLSAASSDADRQLQVTSRGGPITALLLDSFGAFLDYKFREFDYYMGVYDAIATITDRHCGNNYPAQEQYAQRATCRDRLSRQLYHALGIPDNPKSRYVFALMARQEFGHEGGLRYAYDPMPPENRDFRIIYEGLIRSVVNGHDSATPEKLISTELSFFQHLRAEGFEPTPSTDGTTSLLKLIMEDPEYWQHELVNRATNRMIYLEQRADAVYSAREPDPEKRDRANTTLMGVGALTLRTATYQYPQFSFAPSTAPESWWWRYIIPYEIDFDFMDGDALFFWQPTWHFKEVNAGLRLGFGFTGGIVNANNDDRRENYGVVGLDLTRIGQTGVFSGWGLAPAVYHNWETPAEKEQTSFGLDVHLNLLKNRLRISLGVRDLFYNAEDSVFLTVGIADLPGLVYWVSR